MQRLYPDLLKKDKIVYGECYLFEWYECEPQRFRSYAAIQIVRCLLYFWLLSSDFC
ncbi:hypothetical protein KsCSTR_05840 [Candidatus Kuenenia stuttgartiensis]|uniref:Uncharacterized protein n=1 Tax=Kuenenia stuttgartiensis TaxID=174633 RepID=Q1PZZ7_KUEST|nr:hypothetical protein KsCSTR_05840 [Candidatus Kuenenia stuttgartiensis]CAJ72657.1 unknown protein [Candidatus Kuenenia stuttgartiensis]